MKNKKTYIALIFCIILGIISTHYLEGIETKALVKIKNLLFYGSSERVQFDGEKIVSRYDQLEEEVINPVHVSQISKDTSEVILNEYRNTKVKDFDFKKLVEQEKINTVVKTADILIDIGVEKTFNNLKFVAYPYNFDYSSYKEILKAPWYSGMAQGLAIENLLAAYVITGQEYYLEYARLSANALQVEIKNDGTAVYLKNGEKGIWFEEYASKNNEPSYALNGHNFALIGLSRLTYFDESYKELYNSGIKGTESLINEFDAKYWSRYDLVKYMANPTYQEIHVEQMKELYDLTGNEIFDKYARKFRIQEIIPLGVIYRLIKYPHNSLIIVTIMNIIFAGIIFSAVCILKNIILKVR